MDYNVTWRKKDKGWQCIISYKVNGKWKQKSKQGFKSQKDGKTYISKTVKELSVAIENDLNCEYEGIKFKEFTNMYLEHLQLYKENNTIKLYKCVINKFNQLHNMKLSKITSLDIQRCVDNLIKENLSYNTVVSYYSKIRSIFNAATNQYKIITKSPVIGIVIKTNKETIEKRALTKLEFNDLINKTKNMKYKVMFLLAGTCGLRIGEILGLTWDNVDFKNKIITVNKQWKFISSDQCGFGTLKSKNSYRSIPAPLITINALKDYKKNYPIDISNSNRIICYKKVQGISWLIKNHLSKLGYNITIHELRHTYATNLIANGVDFKTAAKLLGHTVEQTMRTYSHVNDDMMKKATNIIENIF